MANVFISVGKAFAYAGGNTFRRPLRWLLLAASSMLEALCFMSASGFVSDAFVR